MSRVSPRRLLALLLVAVVAALATVGSAAPAHAHARLIASDPADQATVEEAPREVVLRFNEAISADFATVQVTGPDGERVDAEAPAVAGDHVSTRLLPLATPGEYAVAYRVVSSDGHPVEGSFAFTLSEAAAAAPPAPTPGEEPAPEPEPEPTAAAPATEATPAPTPAPAPPPEPAPSDDATELTAARERSSGGIAPGVLAAAVAVLVVLAGVGVAATRRSGGGGDASGDDTGTAAP